MNSEFKLQSIEILVNLSQPTKAFSPTLDAVSGIVNDVILEHIYRNDALIFRNLETSYNGFEEKGSFYEEKPEDIVASYSSAGQVYAVCRKNNELFAAIGQKGIACLDAVTLEQKYVIPTQGVCMDCCVYEDTLFSAECEGGRIEAQSAPRTWG